jgi:hypothetical protein
MTQPSRPHGLFNSRRMLAALYVGVRYYAAFMLLGYGFAKVMGAQFTVLDSQLAKPMGDVSGFWLTWYYFGYSPVYSAVVSGAQIFGAILLCFKRTALAGALLLLPVMVNIVSIDLWVVRFPFDSGALLNAVFVLLAILVVLSFHVKDLYRFLLKQRLDLRLMAEPRLWSATVQVFLVLGMVAYAAHEGYWLANVNNRAPTSIDGAWQVVQAQPARPEIPQWIYFEYNRAYMAVFRFPNGDSETHDFRVDDRAKTLSISKEWLTPGSEIFQGTWERSGDTLSIRGMWSSTLPETITLRRKQMPVTDHR